MKFSRPLNVTQLRAFLGLASFYRSFMPRFAETAWPLHALFKKIVDDEVDWSDIHDRVATELIDKLVTVPVLTCDDGTSQL